VLGSHRFDARIACASFKFLSARFRPFLHTVLVMFAIAMALPSYAAVDYTYDEQGRLVGVYAPSGDAAQYVYDAVGNIIEIKRFAAGTLSLIEFTPNGGPVGSSVTIYGTGFSTTAASNTVKINTTTATVTSASATKLVATIPTGATTGKISVTVGATTVMSLTNYVVGTVIGPPTITSFTPTGGTQGPL
jgi:YD repeat-containing protein